ncbi:ACP S-malonyltransferase [Endozoicomonas sp. SM1973]|uniref:Malonyl CoA-acyl carrier protein transacylase n=1 Tax=Spartinivicinus marinus TaxID=2994442 RepID=A0A853HTB0_9GAMM|nr:ACP S-malonyltransferase [Spartinivicinus marinus]MCX4029436.1 ACP S-malonyltransferase [Spartinivicinus marinus]NYZ65010.1 ACP S-malonyltransferase [Spartinivicinus marinus]
MTTQFAFVFPGQGSQQVGMLSAIAAEQSVIQETFAEASAALGYDLWQLVQQGPAESLNQTEQTQPAILTASVALWRLWQAKTAATPVLVAGHSLGEYSALVCAESLPLADAVKLVRLRGRLMQEAVAEGEGAMAAVIGLDDGAVAEACTEAAEQQVVAPVNYNSPGQVVIAGHREAVERAMVLVKDKGAKKVMPLPVSVPSHCLLMKPAAEKLAEALAEIDVNQPKIPVLQNVTASTADTIEQLRENLVKQLYSPVLWVNTVQAIADAGVDTIYECGPGKVLSGLNKRINRRLTVASLEQFEALEAALAALNANFS